VTSAGPFLFPFAVIRLECAHSGDSLEELHLPNRQCCRVARPRNGLASEGGARAGRSRAAGPFHFSYPTDCTIRTRNAREAEGRLASQAAARRPAVTRRA
jgi:hypothetical protein